MDKEFKKLCRIAGETIVKYRLIADGDRNLAGASGGKDSFVLLHLLDHLQKTAPVHFDFIAATFDPRFPGFGVETTVQYCREHNWKHEIISLDIPDPFGKDLDAYIKTKNDIMAKLKEISFD
jgi:tRNA 2-thiocytidine biosynthesis protein TtcA